MDIQLNELSKGDNSSDSPNKYNLTSKKKEGKYDILNQSSREEKSAKEVENNIK
jgi:hypothetical protein